MIDTSIVNVAMPDIQGNLGATLSEVGWISTGYACANVVMIPLTAWLGDRFGRKQYLLFSLAGFTAASVLCGMSTTLPTMLVFSCAFCKAWPAAACWPRPRSLLFETFPEKTNSRWRSRSSASA